MENLDSSEVNNEPSFKQSHELTAELQELAKNKELLPNNINALVVAQQIHDGIDVGEKWFSQNVPDGAENDMWVAFITAYERDFPLADDNLRYPKTRLGRVTRKGPEQGPAPDSAEKAAQSEKAARYYFGPRRLQSMLRATVDPALPGPQGAIVVSKLIKAEFALDDAQSALLSTELEAIADAHNTPDQAKAIAAFLQQNVEVQSYEERLRQRFNESQDFTALNETFSYHLSGDDVFLHLAPCRTLTQLERGQQLLGGLQSLATALNHDPELSRVEEVKMISLLVTTYRKVLTQLGFSVHEVEDEDILQAFSVQKGSLLEASMPKDKFTQTYGS